MFEAQSHAVRIEPSKELMQRVEMGAAGLRISETKSS
jgi:hypothetical protein